MGERYVNLDIHAGGFAKSRRMLSVEKVQVFAWISYRKGGGILAPQTGFIDGTHIKANAVNEAERQHRQEEADWQKDRQDTYGL